MPILQNTVVIVCKSSLTPDKIYMYKFIVDS